MTHERNGDWMQTATGSAFWPCDPHVRDVHFMDIAHSLSNTCRYNGHCKEFYSVAEHSVIMVNWVAAHYPNYIELVRWALLHDAAEAYVCDIPRPLKPYLSNYKEIEGKVERVIAERFNLTYPMPDIIKEVDQRILHDEMMQVMGRPPMDWALPLEPLGVTICFWSPSVAKQRFVDIGRYLGWCR